MHIPDKNHTQSFLMLLLSSTSLLIGCAESSILILLYFQDSICNPDTSRHEMSTGHVDTRRNQQTTIYCLRKPDS